MFIHVYTTLKPINNIIINLGMGFGATPYEVYMWCYMVNRYFIQKNIGHTVSAWCKKSSTYICYQRSSVACST